MTWEITTFGRLLVLLESHTRFADQSKILSFKFKLTQRARCHACKAMLWMDLIIAPPLCLSLRVGGNLGSKPNKVISVTFKIK